MNDIDPIEALRELGRAQRQSIEPPHPESVTKRLRQLERRRHDPRRRRRRRILAVTAAVTLVGAGTGVVWAVTRAQRAPNPTTIACYQTADLTSSQIAVTADGSNPVTQCETAWQEHTPSWGPLPPLVGCVSPTGIAVVVPGDNTTCDRLGLTPFDTNLTAGDRGLIAFEDAVTGELLARGCLPPDEVRAVVQTRLTAAGMTDWTVITAGVFTPTEPCGGIEIDPRVKTITILPLPDKFTPPTTPPTQGD